MKISEAISRLNILYSEYGDLDIVVNVGYDVGEYGEPSLNVVMAKPMPGGGFSLSEGQNTEVVIEVC